MAKNRTETEKEAGKNRRLANLKKTAGPGRPKGSRDRRTVIYEALKVIAASKGKTPEEIENLIQISGIEKAIKGSFLHYAEISNGLYGKIENKTDITTGGEKIVTNTIIFADLNETDSQS